VTRKSLTLDDLDTLGNANRAVVSKRHTVGGRRWYRWI